jgi:lipopolysaccharide/colanic/teichoic acid biosynthesis glycosyltransferase
VQYNIAIHKTTLDYQLFKSSVHTSNAFLFYKRTFDIITSLMLLPILVVICLIAVFLNAFFNRGALFFTQDRVGINNQVFKIYKLRTMQGSYESGNSGITSLGQFMRDIHIDELPQIINVLIGDMSLIGPRPEQPVFFQNYAASIQNFALRQSVRPGISGLAQLYYGYTDCPIGAQKKLKWDLEYIKRQGFAMDSHIYLRTYAYVFPRISKRLIGLIKSVHDS